VLTNGPQCIAPLVGCAFVAKKDIKQGEELFYDYRFSKRGPIPSWYVPVPVQH
jgi:hypothetical protein